MKWWRSGPVDILGTWQLREISPRGVTIFTCTTWTARKQKRIQPSVVHRKTAEGPISTVRSHTGQRANCLLLLISWDKLKIPLHWTTSIFYSIYSIRSSNTLLIIIINSPSRIDVMVVNKYPFCYHGNVSSYGVVNKWFLPFLNTRVPENTLLETHV